VPADACPPVMAMALLSLLLSQLVPAAGRMSGIPTSLGGVADEFPSRS